MFSATYNEEVQGMAKKFLNANYFFVRIGILNSAVQNVEQNFIEVNFWYSSRRETQNNMNFSKFSRTDPYRDNFMRGIDCAYSRSVKMFFRL